MVAIAGRMTVKVCLGLEETNGYTTDAEYFELLMKGLLKPRCENGLVEEVAFDKRQPKRVRYFARWESPGNNQKLSAKAIRESHLRWLFCTQRGFPIMNTHRWYGYPNSMREFMFPPHIDRGEFFLWLFEFLSWISIYNGTKVVVAEK